MPVPLSASATIRKQARAALAEFGLSRVRLTHIASRHNDVFRVDTVSRERFVLRLQNDVLTDAQAESQVRWLENLSQSSGVTVPVPVRTSAGGPFTFIESPAGNRRAMLLTWMPGIPARTRNPTVYCAAAEMIARLHLHSQTLRTPKGFICRQLDGENLFGDRFFVRSKKFRSQLRPAQRKTARSAESFVRNAMDALGRARKRFGVIHSDLNLDNIIFHRGQPSPIDFDEFGQGWYVFDLAELIRTSINRDNWRERKKLVVDAYSCVREFDAVELEHFDAAVVGTFVQYLNWAFIHARSDEDLKWVGFCIDVIEDVIEDVIDHHG